MHVWTVAILVSSLLQTSLAVKESDFKTCDKAGFCRRGRALAQRAQSKKANTWQSPYSIDPSIQFSPSKSSFVVPIKSALYPHINFELEVRIHHDGVVRVRVDEVGGLKKRYDQAASWALFKEPTLADSDSVKWTSGKKEIQGTYKETDVRITYKPFKITLFKGGKEEMVLNGHGLFHMEHFREKPKPVEQPPQDPQQSAIPGDEQSTEQVVLAAPTQATEDAPTVNVNAWFEGDTEDDYWEETWISWTDSKPKGPESLSLDVFFPGHAHVYGIPQHAAPLSLPTTTGPNPFFADPYRLYNLDVFEYEASSTMSLYGSIPLLHAHSDKSTVGIFNAIASETWIDVSHPKEGQSTLTHWISESGILDVFLLPGPTPEAVFKQYATLTGAPVLPAHWALGYHQCRWNYVSSEDMRGVQKKFDEEDFPLDVLWLDIEYADDHKYFIWDEKHFPDPVDMINDIAAVERKVVVIVDPHLKRVDNYEPYKQAMEKQLLIKRPDGETDFEGWCWPGSSSWVDFFNPASWDWWKSFFSLTDKEGVPWRWEESTGAVFIWNDMNEPSVFNGPEITLQKDAIHHGGWEHRDVHNINGMLYHNTTARALVERQEVPKRPFVLSRSFFAGSQRHGAIWTGDNKGTWEHMAVGIPMVLADSIAGMSFVGADVGGFFGNPGPELLTRWYQVGIFSPFFRAHAHIDTRRREPYLLEEPYKSIVRDMIKLRYSLLPVWYAAFRETSVTGMPVLRPQYVMFPRDKTGFTIDDQYYIGSSGLLVKPVTKEGATSTNIYLAEDQVYYDYFTYDTYRGSPKGKNITVAAPLDKVPLFIRGGSVVPTRPRPRRSSPLMKYDPFTLTVALDKASNAKGQIYMDDGETYQHEKGEIIWRDFIVAPSGGSGLRILSRDFARMKSNEAVDGIALKKIYQEQNPFAQSMAGVMVDKIVVLGLTKKPREIVIFGDDVDWEYTPAQGARASILVIKKPGLRIVDGWQIDIEA